MGHAGEDSGAIAGVGFAAAGAAVVHVFEHGEGVVDDGMGGPAFDVGDEADAAGVVFVVGGVESRLEA